VLHKTGSLIPRDIFQSLEQQNLSTLYEIRELIEHLILEKGEASDLKELPEGREVLMVVRSGSITYRLERVSCGKGCKGCPHGPYWYGYWKEGGKTRSKYIGKNLAVKADKASV
jgi:hypothetical protein